MQMLYNGNTSVFQTDDKGSIPFTCSNFYGGIRIVANTPHCDCGDSSSILLYHPNMDR